MPNCRHEQISTHGRCLVCHTQLFTSRVLNKAGDVELCRVARLSGLLKDPKYREIERR